LTLWAEARLGFVFGWKESDDFAHRVACYLVPSFSLMASFGV
jgi:hypothetical protein